MAERVEGLSELRQAFHAQSEAMQKKTGARMVVAGGQVLRRESKSLARAAGLVKTGALVKNIAIKRERNVAPGTVEYNLGVRNNFELTRKQKLSFKLVINRRGRIVKRYDNNPFYFRFQELGTQDITARPFLAPALANNVQAVIDAMAKQVPVDAGGGL